jgi:predicted short-subunit dehydrogenase-like oxidoreductase (DUF2520 family)
MTKVRSLALVCAGPISRTTFGRLPHLARKLGPVKSGSLQRASRAVTALGGGRAVSQYQDLDESKTVLLNVPDPQLDAVVAELASALTWKDKVVLLCSSPLDSSQLAPLEALGAAVGSFELIAGFEGQRYVIEGSAAAVREMRALLQHGTARAIVIRRGAKKQYLAGVACASSLLTSMIVASVNNLRAAGVPLKQAHSIAANLAGKSLRDYLKAGVAGSGADLQTLTDALKSASSAVRPAGGQNN